MEQYQLPKKLDFENLRFCIDNYSPTFLYIRLVGSVAASKGVDAFKIGEDLENKTLDFRKDKSGLYMLVDSNKLFHFPLEDYHKGFSLAYERIEPTEDGMEEWLCLAMELIHMILIFQNQENLL